MTRVVLKEYQDHKTFHAGKLQGQFRKNHPNLLFEDVATGKIFKSESLASDYLYEKLSPDSYCFAHFKENGVRKVLVMGVESN